MYDTRLRSSLRAILCSTAMSLCALNAMPTLAAAPEVKTQAPGYYRVMVGDFEVTALNDGTLQVPADKVLKQPADKTQAALDKYYLTLPVPTSVNGFLVNTGSKLVLIDSGTGGLTGPGAGHLLANLAAAGYRPEQVDEVLITHMHGDHVGGLARDGAAVFPNAIVRAGKGDVDYWLDPATMQKAPEAARGNFQAAMKSFAPYVAAQRLQPITADEEMVPGIRSWATPGHTPGHTSYVVESRGQRLIVTGDLIHVASVQFDDPTVTVSFDSDGTSAAASRAKVFGQAAREGTLIGAAHLQFPGMGRLRAAGAGYLFVPINYMPVP